jgi:hypothetical protein
MICTVTFDETIKFETGEEIKFEYVFGDDISLQVKKIDVDGNETNIPFCLEYNT